MALKKIIGFISQGDVFRVDERGWLVKISEADGVVRDI